MLLRLNISKLGLFLSVVMIANGSLMGISSAQSLKDIRAREAHEASLNREVAYTRSVCGNSLTAMIDWQSTVNWPGDADIVVSCDGALGALEALCRDPSGKAKSKRINRFVCAGDGSGASLSGSTLRYGASPGSNGFDATKRVLDSKL